MDKIKFIPTLKNNKKSGELISLGDDLDYNRPCDSGLDLSEIELLVRGYNVLAVDKNSGEPLYSSDFRKAKIAIVIACRLSSKRLPRKALLNVGSLSLVELSIKNNLKLKNVDYTVLATSVNPQDEELSKHTYSKNVIFFAGDPDDVIKRYLDAVEPLGADVIVRKTADCPFPSSEIFDILLKEHFVRGADYTAGKKTTVGLNSEIMNVKSLKRIKEYFPRASYSEYMTWYFTNNPEYFKLNIVDLPDKFSRNYRLTVDYKEDLLMFDIVQKYFESNNLEYSTEKLFEFLDKNPEISSINSHIQLKFKSDQELIDILNRETKMKL
jgi:N,N'-diacetyllegionaminate synthase